MNNVSKHYTEKLKFVDEYLNEKPASANKDGFWYKAMGWLAIAAKAYLRYEEMKERKR